MQNPESKLNIKAMHLVHCIITTQAISGVLIKNNANKKVKEHKGKNLRMIRYK